MTRINVRFFLFVIPENFGAIAKKFIWNPGVNTSSIKLLLEIFKNHLLAFCNISLKLMLKVFTPGFPLSRE